MTTRSIRVLAAALFAFGAAGETQAHFGSADFRLDPMTELALDAGSRTPGSVGYWLTPNEFSGYTTVRYGRPNHSGMLRQDHYDSSTLAPAQTGGQPFGRYERTLAPVGDNAPTASSFVEPGRLHAHWTMQQAFDDANASARWKRAFVLDPNSSVTLSGLATLGLSLPSTPSASFEAHPHWTPQVANMGTLSYFSDYSDPMVRSNGILFIGRILNQDPTQPGSPLLGREPTADDFAYSTDAQGHLSLTIFNRSAVSMFGSFEVQAFTSAVPETSTWAAMLSGLGVLAWRRSPRRRLAPGEDA